MVAQITPLPTPPQRNDPANFGPRGDSFLAALPTFATEANALAVDVNQNASTATAKAGEALASANAAALSAADAADSEEQAGIYAAAAQAAAGIPTLAGNGKKALVVKEDETGVEYQEMVDLDSEQTLKNKTLDEGFSEAVTASEGASIAVGLTPFNKKLLTSNLAVSVLLDEGVSRTLWVNPQTFTVTWPAGTQWVGGFAPELPANKWSLITFTGLPVQMSNTDGFGALLWSQP